MLDKLQAYVKQQSFVSHEHFNSELKRLRGAMAQVEDPTNLNLLEETLKHTERERVEAEAASLEAAQYYHTVRSAFGSRGGAPSCDFLTCGNHAVCKSNQNKRAFCECVSCFSGDGFTCYIVRGQLDKSDLSSFKVELSTPFLLAKELHQTVELVPLSASRVVCLFGENTGGRAVVVQVSDGVNLLGRYHFGAKVPMSHIAATKLTEDYGDDDLLVISSHHLMMEPRRPDMYLRDVALVSQNLFAYSYYSRAEKQTKMSLVRLHPTTHQMTPVGEPTVLDTGYNSFVGAISLPSGPETPSTFTYMQPAGKSSVAKVCGVSAEGQVSGCKEVPWAEAELVAADAVKLPDGRFPPKAAATEAMTLRELCRPMTDSWGTGLEQPTALPSEAPMSRDEELWLGRRPSGKASASSRPPRWSPHRRSSRLKLYPRGTTVLLLPRSSRRLTWRRASWVSKVLIVMLGESMGGAEAAIANLAEPLPKSAKFAKASTATLERLRQEQHTIGEALRGACSLRGAEISEVWLLEARTPLAITPPQEEMTEGHAEYWSKIFTRSKGSVEIATAPGTLVILQPELWASRKHSTSSRTRNFTLCSFLLGEAETASFYAKDILNWCVARLSEVKQMQLLEDKALELVPTAWQRAAGAQVGLGEQAAVKGTCCRFAGGWQKESLAWHAFVGADFVTEIPHQRFDVQQWCSPPDSPDAFKSSSRHGSFLDGADCFDHSFFGISKKQVSNMPVSERWGLEVGYEALFDAGYTKQSLRRMKGDVLVGIHTVENQLNSRTPSTTEAQSFGLGGSQAREANFLSFYMNLTGQSIVFDTDGSSSLAALHHVGGTWLLGTAGEALDG
eukprot:g2921.t1